MSKKKSVLVVIGRYLPGFRTGGPVRSTKNLVDALGEEYDIRVLCQDRDLGDKQPYPGIKINEWNKVGNAHVYYIKEKSFTKKILIKLSKEVDMLYLWGCFNYYTVRVLLLKRLGIIRIPVVVAAMGLFSPEAFKLKYWKKKIAIEFMSFVGLFKNIYWSATSEQEVEEIRLQVRVPKERFFIAEDLPRYVEQIHNRTPKNEGEVAIVWISRIAPKKNLKYAIQILQLVKNCKVTFSILGSVFDEKYWDECKRELGKLPGNIVWKYNGYIDSENVVEELRNYHVCLFPTLGENYGHVIQEALSAGCACILSDQTPWKDIEKHNIGYVFSLADKQLFVEAINTYAQMNDKEMWMISDRAVEYAIQNSNRKVQTTGYRNIFDKL